MKPKPRPISCCVQWKRNLVLTPFLGSFALYGAAYPGNFFLLLSIYLNQTTVIVGFIQSTSQLGFATPNQLICMDLIDVPAGIDVVNVPARINIVLNVPLRLDRQYPHQAAFHSAALSISQLRSTISLSSLTGAILFQLWDKQYPRHRAASHSLSAQIVDILVVDQRFDDVRVKLALTISSSPIGRWVW